MLWFDPRQQGQVQGEDGGYRSDFASRVTWAGSVCCMIALLTPCLPVAVLGRERMQRLSDPHRLHAIEMTNHQNCGGSIPACRGLARLQLCLGWRRQHRPRRHRQLCRMCRCRAAGSLGIDTVWFRALADNRGGHIVSHRFMCAHRVLIF